MPTDSPGFALPVGGALNGGIGAADCLFLPLSEGITIPIMSAICTPEESEFEDFRADPKLRVFSGKDRYHKVRKFRHR